MNATLQQFFMVPRFRAAVLGFDGGEAALPPAQREDAFMWQLQSLFAHLQESEKAHYNPLGFCQALRDWEGEPVDVLMQQDASEFVAMLLQQLEGRVMGTPAEAPLREAFGGVFSNELLAQGGRRSERPEPFSYVSVGVKDTRTLAGALRAFVAGETVEYRWGEGAAAATLPTLKRLAIRELPPHLLIHLKRFEFDFATMQQVKINDRFEFPLELDMRPYTTEALAERDAAAAAAAASGDGGDGGGGGGDGGGGGGGGDGGGDGGAEGQAKESDETPKRPDSYYRYQLAGVVVHMGTANSGHYYSFIRERCGARRWFEFNDNLVTEMDPADLETECFGGSRQRPA
ncbi:hypothetical protein JKP88DRAFT_198229, partial [Tribonema minus]